MNVAFEHLLSRFGSAERALLALPDLARKAGRAAPLNPPPVDEILRELETGARLGGRLICGGEPDFPARLAALDPPPPLIWRASGRGGSASAASRSASSSASTPPGMR